MLKNIILVYLINNINYLKKNLSLNNSNWIIMFLYFLNIFIAWIVLIKLIFWDGSRPIMSEESYQDALKCVIIFFFLKIHYSYLNIKILMICQC